MRIAVIGAGGVGGYFGGRLAAAGVDTTFIARGATLEALRSRGLTVESVQGDFTVTPVRATDDPRSIGPVDVVLTAVKAWQLDEVAAAIAPLIGATTVVVPLENGIDAPDILARHVGGSHVAGGLCAIVSFIVQPGHIRHAAYDPFVMFGELDNRPSDRLRRLRDLFVDAGVKAEVPDDIHKSMWTKFLFIAPMSGIGAVTRVPVGAWRSHPEVRAMTTAALEEIVAVAAARGVDLGPEAVGRTWERYDAMTPESTASLQRDVMAGRPSELDAQVGTVVRLGREHAVATPVHTFLYHALLPQERIARERP
jgi:2-dehydropantoate 2-reductase